MSSRPEFRLPCHQRVISRGHAGQYIEKGQYARLVAGCVPMIDLRVALIRWTKVGLLYKTTRNAVALGTRQAAEYRQIPLYRSR